MAKETPKTLAQSIDDYINRGFGSMNKNDFEIFIFNEYLKEPGNSKLGDYDLSLRLRIPKAKVRRLRYEASLKYPVSEDMLRNLLDDSLQYACNVRNSVRCIEINVENESVRQYVNALLRKSTGSVTGRSVPKYYGCLPTITNIWPRISMVIKK